MAGNYEKGMYRQLMEVEDLSLAALNREIELAKTEARRQQVTEKLDKGILDFAVLAEEPNSAKYNCLLFPEPDIWGLIMPCDCSLAKKEAICADDLAAPVLLGTDGADRILSQEPAYCPHK